MLRETDDPLSVGKPPSAEMLAGNDDPSKWLSPGHQSLAPKAVDKFNAGSPWNEELEGRLTGMFNGGAKVDDIAKELGVTKNQVIGKSSRLGLTRDKPTRTVTDSPWNDPKTAQAVKDMRAAGKSFGEIASKLGLTRNQVMSRHYNTEPDQGAAPVAQSPSLPKVQATEQPAEAPDRWLMEQLGYKLTPVDHDPFKE